MQSRPPHATPPRFLASLLQGRSQARSLPGTSGIYHRRNQNPLPGVGSQRCCSGAGRTGAKAGDSCARTPGRPSRSCPGRLLGLIPEEAGPEEAGPVVPPQRHKQDVPAGIRLHCMPRALGVRSAGASHRPTLTPVTPANPLNFSKPVPLCAGWGPYFPSPRLLGGTGQRGGRVHGPGNTAPTRGL